MDVRGQWRITASFEENERISNRRRMEERLRRLRWKIVRIEWVGTSCIPHKLKLLCTTLKLRTNTLIKISAFVQSWKGSIKEERVRKYVEGR